MVYSFSFMKWVSVLEKRLYLTYLYDIYSVLLTERQKTIFELYYFNDYSLQEIGDDFSISKQGVRSSLLQSEKYLQDYENKLMLFKKQEKRNNLCDSVLKLADFNTLNSVKEIKIIEEIKTIEKIKTIIEELKSV